jgi:hypothetical protein
MQRPEYLDRGEPARLIPVTADSNKEARAASIFLATLMAVPSFAKEVLGTIGQRVGARTGLQCFTEVRFKNEENTNQRPDGLILFDSGRGRTWSGLVEAKIGSADLSQEQVEAYVQLARANGVSAVVTISNQFVALPTHSPVKIPKALLRSVDLYHWSWTHLKTVAHLLLNEDEFESKDQRYILSEFFRYFDHESVGVSRFDRMNSEWKEIVGKVVARAPLVRNSPLVENTVAAWHQETRDICLLMTQKLRRPVRLRLSRAHSDDPALRMSDDADYLARHGELRCTLEIPDAAAPIAVSANLGLRSITVAMSLEAPKDRQRSSARVNWLLRQLVKSNPEDIHIRLVWPGRGPASQFTLTELREKADSIVPPNSIPTSFDISLIRDIGGKFSGAKTFIEQLEDAVPHFYSEVGERLRAYVAPPPRLVEQDADVEGEETGGHARLPIVTSSIADPQPSIEPVQAADSAAEQSEDRIASAEATDSFPATESANTSDK